MSQAVDYQTYLQSEDWAKKREWALIFWGHKCALCFSKEHLDVHHRTYERLGNELITDLIVLCHDCHFTFHKSLERRCDVEHISLPLARVKHCVLETARL